MSVRDTGPGISAADQTKLFQEFQQADNAITRRRVVPAWGSPYRNASSRCTAANLGELQPGQGSTFAFTLPVALSGWWSGMSKRILVVEDQPDNRKILRDMLRSDRL